MSWMRHMLVDASQSAWLRERAPRFAFVRRTARRFLPGESAADALSAARALADNGIASLLTHLGENIDGRAEADAVVQQYIDLLRRVCEAGLPSEISIKLTQLGLNIDADFCFDNLSKLIEASGAAGAPGDPKTLWIDMEQSPFVDPTLELYRRARKIYRNVGVCLQAYLYRTEQDVQSIISVGGSVRLVKGAYSEPSEIAFPRKSDVDANFFSLAQTLLGPEVRRSGVRTAIATHDRILIARIAEWAASQSIAANQLEFAMLYGIQRAEQLRLAHAGYRTCVLVSYGSSWFPWFMRRLAERPANVLFLARNLFS